MDIFLSIYSKGQYSVETSFFHFSQSRRFPFFCYLPYYALYYYRSLNFFVRFGHVGKIEVKFLFLKDSDKV